MKTIKIIDLLNKIARGEEIPEKIKYHNNIYKYCRNDNRYHQMTKEYPNADMKDLSRVFGLMNFSYLDEEAEIIEEDSKIEKIEIDNQDRIKALSTDNFVYKVNQPMKNIIYKLNELIDTVNELKEDK